MGINLQLPMKEEILSPTITVVGVGGAGGNAVNNMIASNLEGVSFVVANTDAQAIDHSLAQRTIQLGASITRGLGAGANPEVGRAAAEEAADEIAGNIEGSNMLFITAGMGGGTGTGAAPVVARIAREQGILTVAVVTKPFQFEGTHRMKLADSGLKELQEYVDTLIIIPNQNLFRIANERTTFSDAFKMADEVLHSGVRGVTDLMVKPGLINLDFADIRTVMREMGKAMMGTGEATGDTRAVEAAEAAISNPLLDEVSLKGARAALINITGGPDMTLFEVDEAANRIREEVDPEANIIFGSAFNDSMEGTIRVSVVATGIEQAANRQQRSNAGGSVEQKKPYLFNANQRPEPVKAPVRPAAAEKPAKQAIANVAPNPARKSEKTVTAQPVEKKAPATASASLSYKPSTVGIASGNAAVALMEPEVEEVEDYQVASIEEEQYEDIPALEAQPEEVTENEAEDTEDTAESVATEEVISPRQQAAPYREPAPENSDEAASRSIFSRIAEVSRTFSARESRPTRPQGKQAAASGDRQLQVKEKPRAEIVKSSSSSEEDEQFLDIPAFLRRQAN